MTSDFSLLVPTQTQIAEAQQLIVGNGGTPSQALTNMLGAVSRRRSTGTTAGQRGRQERRRQLHRQDRPPDQPNRIDYGTLRFRPQPAGLPARRPGFWRGLAAAAVRPELADAGAAGFGQPAFDAELRQDQRNPLWLQPLSHVVQFARCRTSILQAWARQLRPSTWAPANWDCRRSILAAYLKIWAPALSAFRAGAPARAFQILDNFTWIHGRHTIKFGGEYRRAVIDSFNDNLERGLFSFGTADPTRSCALPRCPGMRRFRRADPGQLLPGRYFSVWRTPATLAATRSTTA